MCTKSTCLIIRITVISLGANIVSNIGLLFILRTSISLNYEIAMPAAI